MMPSGEFQFKEDTSFLLSQLLLRLFPIHLNLPYPYITPLLIQFLPYDRDNHRRRVRM